MTFTSGEYRGYDTDRSVVLFSMIDGYKEVPCAISADAMDFLDGAKRTAPGQREQQFLRLRTSIEQRAERKFAAAELEGNPAGIILRSIDFR